MAHDPDLRDRWVFKGGTCLRKCYYETYRLSEDLDFTVVDGGPEEPDDLLPILTRIAQWLGDQSGIEIAVDPTSFRRGRNRRGHPTTTLKVGYRGPRNPPNLPKVKSELFAEKIRALAERCRPRDLYDVISIHRHPELISDPAIVRAALEEKCAFVNIDVPNASSILQSAFRQELDQEWANMLAHQLPHLPAVDEYWAAAEAMFEWLAGTPVVALPRAEFRQRFDPRWSPPKSMSSWSGLPLDLIRYAGSNRLKVEVDYQAAEGRWGWRRIEPYALRRTLDGNVVLFVVNDRGQLRSYRTDRIRNVRVTDEAFVPRYLVEF